MLYPAELRAQTFKPKNVVGVEGFEPPTFCSQSRRATGLRYTPLPLRRTCRLAPMRARILLMHIATVNQDMPFFCILHLNLGRLTYRFNGKRAKIGHNILGTLSMSSLLLDGKTISRQMEVSMKQRVDALKSRTGRTPILATLLVGDDPASATYVRMKGEACRRVGMQSLPLHLPGTTRTDQLLEAIQGLNDNPDVQGILLQHPVPEAIDERLCFDAIAASKDVDGVGCLGFGRMSMGLPAYGSATPQGIMNLLKAYNIPLQGLHAVVVGRSPILGRPMAMMLLGADCTVTVCHSRTRDLPSHLRHADLIVGAVGKPQFIQADWIPDHAIVIDAGYHPGGIGDIELTPLVDRIKAYTPVPGGVGPMTIATLMEQTVKAAELAF